jgi:Leucine-rich repeat (LRR) protein
VFSKSDLQHLDFSFNYLPEITEKAFEPNKGLQFLSLSHNHIQSISDIKFKTEHYFRHLDLSHNKISSVNQDSYLTLRYLKCSPYHKTTQKLSRIIFSYLKQVQYLTLYRNMLSTTSLIPNAFSSKRCLLHIII